ncbi:short-chain dehydrogenase [Streptomyces sp. NBC_00287]|uniref:short-chain dehydrogenase n=1 Tax=Streptomyces sp. NBC_00287 TaxID=2975702 RepID=UPI002E28C0EA|nr:short-chain dehydrogenase [Streptomyces sp. NBC_00287]
MNSASAKASRHSTINPGVINTGWADRVTDPVGRQAAQELNKIAVTHESVADAVVYALNQPADVTANDLIISPTRPNW